MANQKLTDLLAKLPMIRERRKNITGGTWQDRVTDEGWLQVENDLGFSICSFGDMEDTDGIDHYNAEFVGAAPQDIDTLLALIDALVETNGKLLNDHEPRIKALEAKMEPGK